MKVKPKFIGQSKAQLLNAKTGKPLTQSQILERVRKSAKKVGAIILKESKKGETIRITISNDKVSTDWWTPGIAELFCKLCNKKDTKDCDKMVCQVANPYCG